MGYLICLRCGGYYKLREGESAEDFVSCECYGPLKYVDDLEDFLKSKKKLNKKSYSSEDFIDVKKENTVEDNGFTEDISPSNEINTAEPKKSYDADRIDGNKSLEEELEIDRESHGMGNRELDEYYKLEDTSKFNESIEYEKADESLESTAPEQIIEKFEESKPTRSDMKDDCDENEVKSAVNSISIYQIKGSPVKNRAYYRQSYYGSAKPDINKYKKIKDVDSLIRALKYPDEKIKQDAVQALGVLADQRALKPLEEFLKEETSTLKMYAEIAINQIKSKKNGFKSKNRNYYRNRNYSKKFESSKKEKIEESINRGGKEDSKIDVVTQISNQSELFDKKIPETSIKSKDQSDAKINTKEISQIEISESETTPDYSIKTDKIKSKNTPHETDIYKTDISTGERVNEEKSFGSDSSQSRDSLKGSSDTIQITQNADTGSAGLPTNSHEEIEDSDILPSFTPDSSAIDHDSVEVDNEDDSLGVSSRIRVGSEDAYPDSEISEDYVSDNKSLESVPGGKTLSKNTYLGRNIQKDMTNDNLSVEKQAKPVAKPPLEDKASSKSQSDINQSDINMADVTETLNKHNHSTQIPSELTQSKLSGFYEDKSIKTDNGKTIKIREDFYDYKELKEEFKVDKNLKNTSLMENSESAEDSINSKKVLKTKQSSKIPSHSKTSKKSDADDNADDIYFIKWLGIKNSDKSLIGLIILFALSLLIGVVFTMYSKT
ncbi:MAG: HEAT repeat domain-containing protein [Methanobacteriaceae archaeon]|nr:HEAT repeat domain-containing protein [Methanobacteriaceae archaeon]